ncbi:ABC transporter substrate-binding protein [Paraconexibacter sp. AEG42_29]
MRLSSRSAALFATAALAMTVAACGDDDEGSSGASGTGAATTATTGGGGGKDVKTGPGVTGTTINLGVLTDTSGVFAGLGVPLNEGNQLFWTIQNRKGGVCDRTVKLDVKDHGYDPQKAVSLYREVGPQSLALNQLLGSVMTAALIPTLQKDKMLSVLAGWPSQLLENPNIIVVGATYDLEMINAVDYLVEEGKLKKGDKVGHIYFEGEFGENALEGSKYAAEKQGLTIVEQKIKATDRDMSAAVGTFKNEGVKAILMSTSPTQTASAAGVAAATGLNVPIGASGPAFDPALLKTPAAKALEANLVVSAGTAPYSLDAPGVTEMRDNYLKEFPKGTPKYSIAAGYAESRIMYEILNKACENGDLTREGMQTAVRQLDGLDLDGLVAGTLSYKELGVPPSKAVYISTVDTKADGGLKVDGAARTSTNAEAYEVGGS